MKETGTLRPLVAHETVFVAGTLPPVYLLAISKRDLGSDKQPLAELLAPLFGSRQSLVLTSDVWLKTLEVVQRASMMIEEIAPESPWREAWAQESFTLIEALIRADDPSRFGRALFDGLLDTPRAMVGVGPLGPVWPPWTLWGLIYLERAQLGLSDEQLAAWAGAAAVVAGKRSREAQEAAQAFQSFDVPFGLSPRTDKAPLSRLISEARVVAFLPLAPGALRATELISQGDYVVAFEVVVASGAVTLLIAATFSVAEWILGLPGRTRRRARG